MLRHSLGMEDAAAAVESAIDRVLERGLRTPDLATGRSEERRGRHRRDDPGGDRGAAEARAGGPTERESGHERGGLHLDERRDRPVGGRQGARPDARPALRLRRLRGRSAPTRPSAAPPSSATRTTSSACSARRELYYMDLPFTLEKLREATHELIRANKLRSCYIRPIAFRGYGEMGLFPLNTPVDVVIAVWPWGAYLGEEGQRHGIRCKVASWRRMSPDSFIPQAKASRPVPELDPRQGREREGRLRRGDHARRPRQRLRGLGRERVRGPRRRDLDAAGERLDPRRASRAARSCRSPPTSGFEVVERDIARGELYQADEVFLTGTAAEIVPVREIDDHLLGRARRADAGDPEALLRGDPGQARGVPRVARLRRLRIGAAVAKERSRRRPHGAKLGIG